MPTNTLFNNFSSLSEQEILHSLVYDSIRIYGQDCYYLPRRAMELGMFGADVNMATFDKAYMVELFIKNVEGFNGDTNFLSFHGLEIRDRVTFTMAAKSFANEITQFEVDRQRPNEGDLIFFPLNSKCFQIKFVDDKPFFYQLGTLPMYDLQCELFEYGSETFSTGIPKIDAIQERMTLNAYDFAIMTEDGFYLESEDGSILQYEDELHSISIDFLDDGEEIQIVSDQTLDFNERDPFSEGSSY